MAVSPIRSHWLIGVVFFYYYRAVTLLLPPVRNSKSPCHAFFISSELLEAKLTLPLVTTLNVDDYCDDGEIPTEKSRNHAFSTVCTTHRPCVPKIYHTSQSKNFSST